MSAADVPQSDVPQSNGAQPAPPRPMAEGGLGARLSDVLNPILVREVQQAIKGRVFPLTILIALSVSVVIAAVVASEHAHGGTGRRAFDAGFATLVPLLVFVVPMQAYNSMRTELKGGIVEQLLLSRLSPGRVLAGKLQAAMVQFVLYVSVLSPLLATSYLLRGVDLLTIAMSLFFALIVCVAATAFAVSSAAQAVVPALQGVANLGIAFGLGVATFGLVAYVGNGEYARDVAWMLRSSELSAVLSGVTLVAFLSTTLSWLTARSFLLHVFENRSTGFRIFLWCLPPLVFGWMLAFVSSRSWDTAFPMLSFGLAIVAVVFGVFMVTEQRDLSPRVRAHVPASPLRAALLAPLLPGRDRGLLCWALFVGVLVLTGLVFWPSSGTFSFVGRLGRIGLMVLTFAAVYLVIGRWVRDRLPETLQGSHAGRVMLPVLLFVFCVAPVLVDVLARGRVDSWHIGHVMNPFWTIENFCGGRWDDARGVVIGVLLAAIALQVPTWRRGLAEVKLASAKRRDQLAAKDAAAAAPVDPVDA